MYFGNSEDFYEYRRKEKKSIEWKPKTFKKGDIVCLIRSHYAQFSNPYKVEYFIGKIVEIKDEYFWPRNGTTYPCATVIDENCNLREWYLYEHDNKEFAIIHDLIK